MKEWITVASGRANSVELAKEAYEFVKSAKIKISWYPERRVNSIRQQPE